MSGSVPPLPLPHSHTPSIMKLRINHSTAVARKETLAPPRLRTSPWSRASSQSAATATRRALRAILRRAFRPRPLR